MDSLEQSLQHLRIQYENSHQKLIHEYFEQSLDLQPSQKQEVLQRLLSKNLITKEQYEKYAGKELNTNFAFNSSNNDSTSWILKWSDKRLREAVEKNLSIGFKLGATIPQQDAEDYHIAVCKEEHLEPLVHLFVSYMQFYEHPVSNTEAKEYLTRVWSSDAVILVAVAQTPIGFVVMYPMFECEIMDRFWLLNDMFVDANWRKNNIGGALVEQAKRICLDSGGKKLYLETLKENHSAQKFYSKQGFVPDQVHMTWHLDFE